MRRRRPDSRDVLSAFVIAALAGATAFGLWHLVVGGVVNGNGRAAQFGVALAVVAGALLCVVLAARRRSRSVI